MTAKLALTYLALTSLTAVSLHSLVHPSTAQANSLTISPPLQSIELAEDQVNHLSTLIFSNNYDYQIELSLSVQDFGDLEDGGGLFFLGTDQQTTQDQAWQEQHSLEPWIRLDQQSLTIPANDQATVSLTIENQDNLSPGGHYAAILASITSDNQQNLAINQSLSSLLFVNKQGGHLYDLEVNNIEPQASWWGSVQGANIAIKNTGNTHLVPRGKLELVDPLGKVIGQGIVNTNSSILLPGASHQFDSSIIANQPTWLPGTYTLVLPYRYDGQEAISSQSITAFNIGLLIPTLLITAILATTGYIAFKRRLT